MRVERQPDGSLPNPYEDASPPEFFSASNDFSTYDLPAVGRLSDGSLDYGNGLYGPSFADQERANNTKRRLDTDQSSFTISKIAGAVTPVSAIVISGCMPSTASEIQSSSINTLNTSPQQHRLPYIGLGYLTSGGGGIHENHLDFAPPKAEQCVFGEEVQVIETWPVVATAAGVVQTVGDEKNRKDPNHSVVETVHPDGESIFFAHLAKIQVKPGEQVTAGDVLGFPSCEYKPGDRNVPTGPHVDISAKRDGKPVPFDNNLPLDGWVATREKWDYEGTLTKPDEQKRNADARRCGPPQQIPLCDNRRNDIFSTNQTPDVRTFSTPIPTVRPATPTVRPETTVARPTATPQPEPTMRPSPTAERRQTETITDEDIRWVGLFKMLNTMKQTLQPSSNNPTMIAPNITNFPQDFPTDQILKGKPIKQDSDLIDFSWMYQEKGGLSGVTRTYGSGKLKNIRISGMKKSLTPSDIANNKNWVGTILIELSARYKLIKPFFRDSLGRFIDQMSENVWDKQTIPNASIDFTPWEERKMMFSVDIGRGGQNPAFVSNDKGIIFPTPYNADHNDCSPTRTMKGCEVVYLKWE